MFNHRLMYQSYRKDRAIHRESFMIILEILLLKIIKMIKAILDFIKSKLITRLMNDYHRLDSSSSKPLIEYIT